MLRAYSIILSFTVLILTSCSSPKTNSALENQIDFIGIDVNIGENRIYAKVGKLKLSEYGFFEGKLSELNPAPSVLPYELNTPLFSDYAQKKRFIYLPEDAQIGYDPKEILDFPIGTVLIKNFWYNQEQIGSPQDKIIETRLLIHESNGWKSLPYIWNQEQTEAFLEVTGGQLELTLNNNTTFKYTVPTMTECKSCHDRSGTLMPIGPTARQLNRDNQFENGKINQLEKMQDLNWIALPEGDLPEIPQWNHSETGSLNDRARAYLDINCAHCHRADGPAKNSGLNLSIHETDMYKLGLNKKPVAAGRGSSDLKYGIVAGRPHQSILVHRMSTNEPGTMMPEIGRSLVHKEGVALIKKWIENM